MPINKSDRSSKIFKPTLISHSDISAKQIIFISTLFILLIIIGTIPTIYYNMRQEDKNSKWSWFINPEQASWENPYEDWGKENMVLMGGQGPHLHTISYSSRPDAVIELETIFQIFTEDEWPPSWWAERGVNVGGYHNTNGGYEFLIIGAHNNRRSSPEYLQLLKAATILGEKYGVIVIYGSEVSPPHEGMIWNNLCAEGIFPSSVDTLNSTIDEKNEFVEKVSKLESDDYHSISIILHPQAGGKTGRNSLESVLGMVKAGTEILEIFNGGFESGDELRVNDHNRSGTSNPKYSPADGNAENLWDIVLSQGYRVWGIGSDDFHGYRKGIDPPKKSHKWAGNYCWIEVLTDENSTPENIVRALEKGSFYTTQGVQIESITVEGDTITVIGDDSVDFIEAIGSVGGYTALGALNQGDGDSGTLLAVSRGNKMVYKANPFISYDDLYVRFRLVDTDYDERFYFDEHEDGGGDVYAWTQPFYAKDVIEIIN